MAKTYTSLEIARAVGFGVATIQRYARLGLIPKPPYRGAGTRYGEEHLVYARAVAALTRDGKSVAEVKAALRGKSLADVARIGDVAIASAAPPENIAVEREETGITTAERWARVPLMNGLDLTLRDDASEHVRRVAAEIQKRYAT